MSEKPAAMNADGVSEPFAAEDVPWEGWSEGSRYGTRFRYLSGHGGATHVGVALEELEPRMESSLNHYHMLEEEQAFVLAGEMTLRLGGKTYLMKT
ncbi:MAG: cupin, partial [Phyllobacterium sp.]